MNPAPSVILFTTLSGAGYGITIVAGLFHMLLGTQERAVPIALMLVALVLITIGLSASVFHLGRPERAWRALSQWKSSWLSREGVMALVCYPVHLAFTASWAWPTFELGSRYIWGPATAVVSLGALFTTAMIYRSLQPIAAWHQNIVVLGYLLLGPMTGGCFAYAILEVSNANPALLTPIVLVVLPVGAAVKWVYWQRLDRSSKGDVGNALGLPGLKARTLEWPHTEQNFLMKEMGFVIARKHARRLRTIALILGFALPFVLVLAAFIAGGAAANAAAVAAAVSAMLGVLVERWLFFAEATHTAMLYYRP